MNNQNAYAGILGTPTLSQSLSSAEVALNMKWNPEFRANKGRWAIPGGPYESFRMSTAPGSPNPYEAQHFRMSTAPGSPNPYEAEHYRERFRLERSQYDQKQQPPFNEIYNQNKQVQEYYTPSCQNCKVNVNACGCNSQTNSFHDPYNYASYYTSHAPME